MRRLNIITNSSAGRYQTCPMSYYYRHIVKIAPKESALALSFGSCAHDWLQHFWLGKVKPPDYSQLDPFEQARLRAMLRGYDLRWREFVFDCEVIGTEIEGKVPLVNPETGAKSAYWEVAWKLDALARINGELIVVEHKTSRDTSDGYFERLRMDSQISTYLMATKSKGYGEPAGVEYDVLKKPTLRPYEVGKKRTTAETPAEFEARCFESITEAPEEYYQHYRVVRLESEVTKAARSLWAVAKQIRESINDNCWPQNSRACRNEYGRFCEYWPICSGRSNPEDSMIYENREPFEEISREVIEAC
jgi:hypothetical protein